MKKKIAVFTTGWCCEILAQFLTGMQSALAEDAVDLFLFTCYPVYVDTSSNKKGELNIFKLPDLKDFDGTVIFGSGLDFKEEVDDIVARSKEAGIPVIMQGAKRDGVYYVGSDNYVATIQMCEHLCNEHDVKDIIFFAGTEDSLDSELRLKAVRDYLAKEGKEENLKDVYYTHWENASAARYIDEYCASGKEIPDVFICANDGLAMQTCVALETNGYKVPEDVLVTGYDHIDDSRIFDPSIASVDQCFTQMGEACGQMWLKLLEGRECEQSVVIPCEFVPSDSCNCYGNGSSDKLRRRLGREAFAKRSETTYSNRKLAKIDSTVLSSVSFTGFCDSLHDLISEDHMFEGVSYHMILEPNFGLSINDPTIKLRRSGYSTLMDILYSIEDGQEFDAGKFISKDLIPGYKGEGENHLYVFLPLHEGDEAFGYIVFRDCMGKIRDHFLQTYQSRVSLVFDKFRYALSLDLINKRLLEVMRKDPLTKVNNRRAYEDKEVYLQSEINSETGIAFAIAMFDVNNLKTINDSEGHEAGDDYLRRACRLICEVCKHSPVYRVGGDEFVAVLTNGDYERRVEIEKEIADRQSPYQSEPPLPEDYVSIACGIAEYMPGQDTSVQDICKRADDLMYKNKAMIKGIE